MQVHTMIVTAWRIDVLLTPFDIRTLRQLRTASVSTVGSADCHMLQPKWTEQPGDDAWNWSVRWPGDVVFIGSRRLINA